LQRILVFAPLPLVLPLFRTGALKPVLPECVSQPARIFIHYVSRKHLPARMKAFVNFMLEHLRSNPDLTSDPQALLAPFRRPCRDAVPQIDAACKANKLTRPAPPRITASRRP
jgi:hypothetical protein